MQGLLRGLRVFLCITLPLAVILLCANIALRIPGTYSYHFNDQDVVSAVSTELVGTDFSAAIAGYFNKPFAEEFQVYEQNGEYRDPIFGKNDQVIFRRARRALEISFLCALALIFISLITYFFLLKRSSKEKHRTAGFVALLLSASGDMAFLLFVRTARGARFLYQKLIGITPSKASSLKLLLGDHFEATFFLFALVISIFVIGVLFYLHNRLTKPVRIFGGK